MVLHLPLANHLVLHPRGQSLPGARTPTMTLVQTQCTLKFRLQGAKQDTSCPKLTSPVCSRNTPSISEAHWKPFHPWGLSPVPCVAWSFLHICLHPLENPGMPKQKPMELLWVRNWPLAVSLELQGDWAGWDTGGTDERPMGQTSS